MGCDIHTMIEYAPYGIKDGVDETTYWSTMGADYNPGRDYHLFGLLAGVRGDATLFDQKGLPDDLGYRAKDYYAEDGDLHSHTWLTLDEYRLALATYIVGDNPPDVDLPSEDRGVVLQAVGALRGNGERYEVGYDAILAAMELYAGRGMPVRLIIAFDN